MIMDNVAFYKSQNTRAITEDVGFSLLFFRLYSPGPNSIETFLANLKKKTKLEKKNN